MRDELRLHASYAEQWGVDMTGCSRSPATSAYTDFLLATASLGDVGLTCAAMTPCMRLYAHLGQVARRGRGRAVRGVGPHLRRPRLRGARRRAGAAAGRHGEDTPEVAAAYRRAMELELAFFDASWHGRP